MTTPKPNRRHVEILAEETGFTPVDIRLYFINEHVIEPSQALTAMSRVAEQCRPYMRHKDDCNLNSNWYEAIQAMESTPIHLRDKSWHSSMEQINIRKSECTCGLDELLNTNTKT